MNLLRAISLGGGVGDLRGNDSTILICHVQLCVLAIDWILNILVDNFLSDPLIIMIIFICQALLLIIGLIFYLMASANQAMKEGIQEKLLRHHQLTVGLWTIYFSTLVCWYTWTLKRSWPSAGDHFSFTFSGNGYGGKHKLDRGTHEPLITTTDSNFELPTTISFSSTPDTSWLSTAENSNLNRNSPATTENFGGTTTTEALATSESVDAIPFLAQTRLIDTISAAIQSVAKEATNETKNRTQDSEIPNTRDQATNDDYYKFFWSPGFISVYVIERSASLLFYTVYILGTMHIVNAHLLDKQNIDTEKNTTHGHNSRNELSQNRMNQEKDVYAESDSNLDDNFIRQLEDQDGDPFDNEQYGYQYRLNRNKPSAVVNHDNRYDSQNGQAGSSSETDEAYPAKKPRKQKRDGLSKAKNDMKHMVPESKGALKNMMIASKFRKNSGPTLKKPIEWFHNTQDNEGVPTSSKGSVFGEYKEGRNFVIETELAPVTTSSSIDTMATGSTDELLVAQVFTREDKKISRTQAFHNDYGQSEENLYSYTH
ncbi:unnamed protein product [Allacma fusca]|uniref:Uncharacterized protein n=3 Tax=Allacma fusca TaxID=39272 RepID=A0A8J2JMG0_9HEXA|nr:unnamed protein product [Allacma fusca]